MTRDDTLQRICRRYMLRLVPLARKFGLGGFVMGLVRSNYRRECAATEDEVAMLSRMCDDERLRRDEVPGVLGKSYRQSYDDGDFGKVRTLRRVGIYSKISALLLGEELRAINDE